MAVRIILVEKGSIGDSMGWDQGDQILKINGHTISDVIDLRFHASDEELHIQLRSGGILKDQEIEKDATDSLGIEVEEFRIKTCGDDCIFCFVDQNPPDLRASMYFRDGDYRMSFLYGNYITMTNLRQRELDRIVEQRLSPLYISVHSTDDMVRRKLMGRRSQDDRLMQKLRFLRENRIEMHTQIVLVPGYNDGHILEKSVADLYQLNDAIQSVSVVPVGLTAHRRGLQKLRSVTIPEAVEILETIHSWQQDFRPKIGRGFVYASDEFYLLSQRDFPSEDQYDGYPLMENGVGMCRDFIEEMRYQQVAFPTSLERPKHLTMVTGKLAETVLRKNTLPALNKIGNLKVDLIAADNLLFGPSVTVSGLLNYRSFAAALSERDNGDLVLLPPDCVNFEGDFLDNVPGMNNPEDLAAKLRVPTRVFEGDWGEVIESLM